MNKPEINYFYVNRELLNSNRWLSEPFTRGQAWVDLFGLAQHTKGFFRVRGIKITVERGQLAYSQLTLAKRWQWSRGKVNRYLSELENQNDITLKTIQQNGQQIKFLTTLITIVKYDKWQGDDTAKRTPDGHQTDTKQDIYNNDKNVKNDKNEDIESNDSESPTKEITITEEKNEINLLIERFKQVNPTYTRLFSKPPQRASLERLIKQFGFEQVGKMIDGLTKIFGKPYAPRITTPYQLEEKLADYISFLKQKSEERIPFLDLTK